MSDRSDQYLIGSMDVRRAPVTRNFARRRQFKASSTRVTNSVDLVREILMRLPAKLIFKCKAVSKQWYCIICDPNFIVDYARRNPPEPQLFYMLKMQKWNFCNGLLCYSKPHKNAPQNTSYYVCNPVSGRSKLLRMLGSSVIKKLMAMNLVFDPTKSAFYSLIFVTEESRSESYQVIKIDIYSSETQSWRPSSKGLYIVPHDVGFSNGVYWNGSIYWCHLQKKTLAYFNFDTDSLERLEMPQLKSPYPMSIDSFGVSGGHLHIVGTCSQNGATVFNMKKDSSGWFVKSRSDSITWAYISASMVRQDPLRNYLFSVAAAAVGEEGPGDLSVQNIEGGGFKAYKYLETLASP